MKRRVQKKQAARQAHRGSHRYRGMHPHRPRIEQPYVFRLTKYAWLVEHRPHEQMRIKL